MSVKLESLPSTWVDPDDAPELDDDFFERGTYFIDRVAVPVNAGKAAIRELAKRGRPPATSVKQSLTIRYDADVIAAFKASGKGWQTRMNNALKDWLKTHEVQV